MCDVKTASTPSRHVRSRPNTRTAPAAGPKADPRLKTVVVALNHDILYGQEVFRGILSYARPERPWILRTVPPQAVGAAVRAGVIDGVIGILWHDDIVAPLIRRRVPAVNVSGFRAHTRTPAVAVDNEHVGRLAAEHLIDRGHAHFAFYGPRSVGFANGRLQGFVERLRREGKRCETRSGGAFPVLHGRVFAQSPTPNPTLLRWLLKLPKPVGVFAASDYWGLELSQACQSAGLRVPEEVALIGVDDDDRFCECAWPPLSSVRLPSRQIGFEAAAMLDRAMAGERLPAAFVSLPSPGLVTRRSSDWRATSDDLAADAARFISDHAGQPLGAADVAAHANASRRALEMHFRKAFGRSIGEEIARARVELAKRLLADTDLKMPVIAARAGFSGGDRLSVMFRRLTGLTPTAYRRQSRIG
jgi:LacI family transcriptional regulator